MKQIFFALSPKKRAFLTGTLLLTGTGFLCRILGFFYRIFMSRTIGAEGLGIYNMVHPVFGICFALCAGSIQTALSQYVASNQKKGRAVFRTGLFISLTLSLLLALFICNTSPFIARYLLLEPRCEPYLMIMALSVPFAALHACINGYYYGMQKSHVPAFSQVAEQVIRMGAVFGIVQILQQNGREITVSLAVYGHLIGEMASAAFTFTCLILQPEKRPFHRKLSMQQIQPFCTQQILKLHARHSQKPYTKHCQTLPIPSILPTTPFPSSPLPCL